MFYSYLKSCVWLLLVAATLPVTSVSFEWSFSKMKLLKKFPRNSMTSERLGNDDLSGVSRVWQAWHMPWAPLWRAAKTAGKIKIFIYSSFNLYCAPHAFINCKAASTPRPYLKHYVGRVALAPLSIITKLRYCDITRGSTLRQNKNARLPCSRGLVLLTL